MHLVKGHDGAIGGRKASQCPRMTLSGLFLRGKELRLARRRARKALPFELRLGTVDAGRGRGCRAGEGKEARKR